MARAAQMSRGSGSYRPPERVPHRALRSLSGTSRGRPHRGEGSGEDGAGGGVGLPRESRRRGRGSECECGVGVIRRRIKRREFSTEVKGHRSVNNRKEKTFARSK